jgi:monovalent cation/hydrogen antiporter
MSAVELVVILLGVSAALQVLARRINVPHPVLLVLGGLGLALIPSLPRIGIAPDTLFLVFVPPLLYWAALTTSLRDFWREFSAIARYATLVVLLTMSVVAAIAVLRPLGAPRDMVTILEGEGLVNDATALVAYQIGVAAVVAGSFSPAHAGLRFIVAAGGGIAIGLAVGWLIAFLREHLLAGYPIVENTLSLLTPFLGYLPADRIGASRVLSVADGRRRAHDVQRARRRPPALVGAAQRQARTELAAGDVHRLDGPPRR